MIAPLRRAHRVATLALALAVPPAFAVAIASRPEPVVQDALAPALVAEPSLAAVVLDRDDLWSPLAIRTRVGRDAAGAAVVELAPRAALERPDVLVYWSAEVAGDRLPADAHWLGRLAGTTPRRFALPDAARARAGRLHLYSLGHAQWLGSAALEMR